MNPGTRLGPYEVTAKLGEGGMGEVYQARDTALDRDVAIKVLPEDVASDPDRLARFEREAKSLAALNHPNIAQIYGVVPPSGFEDVRPPDQEGGAASTASEPRPRAIVMELVDGPTLADRIGQGALSLDEALPIARQIAEALDTAHERGIVHRDLKPANIKVKDDGTVKVLDFGLAKAMAPEPGSAAAADVANSPTITARDTSQGIILGTAAYMAPEQARGRVVDRRADIWAFGVVFYEMLTGTRLFDGRTGSDVLAAVLTDPVPWSRLPAGLPPVVRKLLTRCLERDPRRRLRDIGDARLELDASSWSDADVTEAMTRDTRPGSSRLPERVGWVAAMMAVGALVWWAPGRGAPADAPWSRATALTTAPDVEGDPVISPDGNSFAFVSSRAGSDDIYWQRVGSDQPRMVAGDPAVDEGGPAFSPDGERLAYHIDGPGGGIFVSSEMGEDPQRLTDGGFNPAWSPDGASIVYATQRAVEPGIRSASSGLWVIAVNDLGAEPWRLTDDDAMQPAWSPGGSRIAFWGVIEGQRDLFTIAASGGETVAVTNDTAVDWSPVWSPDGGHLYFASDRGGPMSLWRIAIDEATGVPLAEPEAVTLGSQAGASLPSLSTDGRRLVFRSRLQSINPAVMAFDPDTETLEIPAEPRFLFQQSTVRTLTSISPDGEWLAYSNIGEHQEDLFVSRSDGSDMRRVVNDAAKDRSPIWASDSEHLVFYSNRSGSYEVWMIRQDGSDLTQVSDDPDLIFTSTLYSPLTDQIIANVFDGGAPRVFDATAEGTRAPVELLEPPDGRFTPLSISLDGSRLAGYWLGRPNDDDSLALYNLMTRTWRRVGEMINSPKWLPGGHRVLYLSPPDLITLLDVDTGREQPLGRLPYDIQGGLVVAPDGRAAYVSVRSTTSDIWMLERAR